MPPKKNDEYDKTYTKMTLLEQIMHRPDTYVGSLERTTERMWVYNSEAAEMELRDVDFVPGLYKIFDEILVNAADNRERDASQNKIKVVINKEKGYVQVWNNGEGVPVHMHKQHNMYIPDMIFGHLLTSSNYDDTKKKTTGGRNGFGAKLANIFSTKFTVETCHVGGTGKTFKKTWSNNMRKSVDAVIADVGPKDTDFTSVTFWPDFKLFGMDGFEDDAVALFEKRVIDIAGVTDKALKVYLNGKVCPVQDFQSYVDLFPGMGEDKVKDSYACPDPRWQICIRPSNIDFQQVSFVNSIWTIKGGRHVNYIVEQVVAKVVESIKKKNGKKLEIQANQVRPFLWVFVNSKIENPSFDSQTKETLNTTKSKFGSSCEIPQKMIDQLCKVISERVLDRLNNKINKEMARKVGKSRLVNVPKLDDANDAGTKKGHLCTLILTEGDSAKSMVTSGLGKLGRDRFGCFPLRGKPLNVREATQKQIADCKEIQNLIKIIGLKPGVKYTSRDELRYGSVMIMTDQDHDGSHIKGLLINMFHTMWPGLLNIPGFLVQFITPIVKAFPAGVKNPEDHAVPFFTIPDFVEFKTEQEQKKKRWNFKYYKGLGTSTTREAKEYFENMDEHKIDFVYDKGGPDDRSIELAFSKTKIDARKQWILDYKPGSCVDYNAKSLGFTEFINKELILFSIADCERSIPNVVDGLKPAQRKVLFACFKRNLTREIKVAQFSGYVSEHAAYHHGEVSLQGTIINMAQNFTGSNNLPFLVPCGQFGSRAAGGKDSASPRYIFTKLDPVTRCIFPKVDDNLLTYKDDDGMVVEPEYYMPIIPTALLNGQTGIGTGFSTAIPNHNPLDLIKAVKEMLAGEALTPLKPWFRGFTGPVAEKPGEEGKFSTEGIVSVVDTCVVRVTELPIKYWSDSFKDELVKRQEKGVIMEFRNHITGDSVDVDVALRPELLANLRAQGALLEFFGLTNSLAYTNLICFDHEGVVHKYTSPADIIKEWYLIRHEGYVARKKYMIGELEKTTLRLENMVRFITEVNKGDLSVRNRKRAEVLADLKKRGYAVFVAVSKKKMAKGAVAIEETDTPDDAAQEGAGAVGPAERYGLNDGDDKTDAGGYEYLLNMKIWSLTFERAKQLEEQMKAAKAELENLRKVGEKDMWVEDLTALEVAVAKANERWNDEMKGTGSSAPKVTRQGKAVKRKIVQKQQTRLSGHDLRVTKISDDAQKAIDAELGKISKNALTREKKDKAGQKRKAAAEDGTDAAPAAKKPRASAKAAAAVDVDAEDDDDDEVLATTKAKKPAPKKPAPKKRKRRASSISFPTTEETSSTGSDEDSSSGSGAGSGSSEGSYSESESSSDMLPAAKRARKAAPKKASPKKAAPKKASPAKAVAKAAPKAAPKRAAAKNTLVLDDDDDDDEYVCLCCFCRNDAIGMHLNLYVPHHSLLGFDPSRFGIGSLK